MATLPDPIPTLAGADRAALDRSTAARAHAEGRTEPSAVFLRMFNNPGVAEKVAALGEQLRFHGTLPDDVRETVILRRAYLGRFEYEWAHHQRPARMAGLDETRIDLLRQPELPDSADETLRTIVEIVDTIIAGRSIPRDVQERFVAAHGTAGIVEVAVLCGHYALMGYMTTAFDIEVEDGLPRPPFW